MKKWFGEFDLIIYTIIPYIETFIYIWKQVNFSSQNASNGNFFLQL